MCQGGEVAEFGGNVEEVQQAGVQLNKIAGDAFRDDLAEALTAAGRTVEKEVFKRTPFGARFIDIQVSMDDELLVSCHI